MPSYRSLEVPHAQVHEATRGVFDILDAEDPTAANMELIKESLTRMEEASDGVFQHLDQMLVEKLRNF